MKKKKNPLVRLTVAFFLLVLIGFFIFYAIDNPGFLGGVFDRSGNEENVSPDDQQEVETEIQEASYIPENPSAWQRIILFFKQKFNPPEEGSSYPPRITINTRY